MLAGISTACFYPQYTEEALKIVTSLQAHAAEVFLNCEYELDKTYLRELKQIALQSNTKILSVHPYTSGTESMYFFTKYDRRFAEGRDFYKRYYEAACLLGAEIVVFHGCHKDFAITDEEYFERVRILLEDAKKQDVFLCQENVERCKSNSLRFLRNMADSIPEAGFVLDIKQAIRSAENIQDFVQLLGNRIRHIHISDHNSQYSCLPLGTGVFDIARFLFNMREQGFNGGVILELYRDNFKKIQEIQDSYQHLLRAFQQAHNIDKPSHKNS